MKKPFPFATSTLPMTTTKTAHKPAVKTTRRTQDERSKDTQQRVIAAAIEMLRRKGYAGFRVNDVAEAAKVSRGAQTHHFPTKDSLVFAAIEHIFREALENSEKRVQALKPGDDVIAAMLKDGEDFFLGPHFPVALDLLNLGNLGGKFRKQLQAMARETRLPAEMAWRNALVEHGLAQKQAEDILWLSYSIIRGLVVRRLIQDDGRIEETIKQWHDIATAMVSGQTPAITRR